MCSAAPPAVPALPHLPRDVLEVIADFADIDTRRALGFGPRKICGAVREHVERLLARKLACRFEGYTGLITTLFITRRRDEAGAVSAMHLRFDRDFDTLDLIHVTGRLVFHGRNFITFSAATFSSYCVSDPYGAAPRCALSGCCGLGTHVTTHNRAVLMEQL